jgi:hypothetical protein
LGSSSLSTTVRSVTSRKLTAVEMAVITVGARRIAGPNALYSTADMAGSPIQPSIRFVIVMQTWIVPMALAGLAFSRSIAAAERALPRRRSDSTCAGRSATTAYSPATKKALRPIRKGTAARDQPRDMGLSEGSQARRSMRLSWLSNAPRRHCPDPLAQETEHPQEALVLGR